MPLIWLPIASTTSLPRISLWLSLPPIWFTLSSKSLIRSRIWLTRTATSRGTLRDSLYWFWRAIASWAAASIMRRASSNLLRDNVILTKWLAASTYLSIPRTISSLLSVLRSLSCNWMFALIFSMFAPMTFTASVTAPTFCLKSSPNARVHSLNASLNPSMTELNAGSNLSTVSWSLLMAETKEALAVFVI